MERKFWTPYMSGAVIGILSANVGSCISDMIDEGHEKAEIEQRIEETQLHNAELYEQLSGPYDDLNNLVLNERYQSFRFVTTDGDELHVSCEGNYNVVNEVATVTGKIACTSEIELSK